MQEFLSEYYLWVKALHLVAVISWLAGLFYLPRLFVYHADAEKGSELSETFKIMERKLLRLIMNPAMIVTWLAGLSLLWAAPDLMKQGWMHAKLTLVFLMTGFHMFLARWRKGFLHDRNTHGHRFYRKVNEIPTVLMICIVILVIVKPF